MVYSEQARMERTTNMGQYQLIAQPVEETPLERFMTMNGAEDANNLYARDQMREIGIGLGDERTTQVRQKAAERLAADLLASKETKEKKEKKKKKKRSMSSP
jgi:hypothetical protein